MGPATWHIILSRPIAICLIFDLDVSSKKPICSAHLVLLRRDKYEKNVECFWVETKVGGRKLPLGCTRGYNMLQYHVLA